MRIVRDDAGEYQAGRAYVDITPCYAIKDTVEVTDKDWDEIMNPDNFYKWIALKCSDLSQPAPKSESLVPSQHLRELIELARAK